MKKKDIVLKTNNISVNFDGFYALTDVSVEVKRNDIHFFIGPNGAGKTTLLDIICGKTSSTDGTVDFYPKNKERVLLTGMKEYEIVEIGVGRKFQVPSIFINLTVFENMELSLKGYKGIWNSIIHKITKEEKKEIERTLSLVGLEDRIDVLGGELAHGEKQWLEIAMQLIQKPELIILDEPAGGMGKVETFKSGEILKDIKKECTVIVVEHDMEFVKQVADTVTVLHEGKVLVEGNIDDVLKDKTVQAVYLGRGGE